MQTEGRSRGQSESYNQNTQRLGGADDPQRAGYHAGRQVHFAVTGPAPVLFVQIRFETAPELQVHRLRPIKKKNAFDLDKLINRRRRPGLSEACEVYEVDASEAGPVSEDEDILNYDDVDDPDAYV